MRQPTIISNLAERVVAGPVADAGAPGTWRWGTYQTADVKGTLLSCGARTEPTPVTISLGVDGLWRVWLGIAVFREASRIRARLTGDRCCREFQAPPTDYIRPVVHEAFFKDADLTGKDLVVDGSWCPEPAEGALAWVRLEPIDAVPAPGAAKVAHPLTFTEDGHGVLYSRPHRRPDDLLEDYDQLPDDTALRSMLWCAVHGDMCSYPTRIGQYGFQSPSRDYPRYGDVTTDRNFALWKENGWDMVAVARDYCRGRGWEFHLAVRIQTFSMCFPNDETGSRFFHEHPECWCRDAEGRAITRMSYAHPAVRERFLGIIDELVAYEPDGVNLTLIRGLPLVFYEPVMVEGFRTRHGADPRTLDENDPRWCDYQAEVITDLMRQVKGRLGKGMRLSAIVPGHPDDLRRWGLDVPRWLAEGIVDDLYPIGQRFTDHDVHIDAPEALDYEWFESLPGRANARLIPALYPWRTFGTDPPRWHGVLRSFLDRDPDGYCIWDGMLHDWRQYVDVGLAAPPARQAPAPRTHRLTMIGGFRVDRYHPIEPF